MTHVTFVGVGNMGGAILDGLLARGWSTDDLSTVGRRVEEARDGVAYGTLAQMAPGADVVLVAVKPAGMAGVLGDLGPHLSEGAVVVSVAAGLGLAELERALGTGHPVVRVMPNTPAKVGEGVSVLSAGSAATEDHLELVAEIFRAVGIVEVVPESLQDAVTGVSGSGPAYVFAMADALIEAGVQQGLPRPIARRMAVQTFLGASTMLAQGEHPVQLREAVSSPGGTTVLGLRELDRHGVRSAIFDAVEASRRRSEELGRQ